MQTPFRTKPRTNPSRRFFKLLPAALLPMDFRMGRFFFVNRRYKSVSIQIPIKLRYMVTVTATSVLVMKGKKPSSIPRNCPSMMRSTARM